MHDRHDACMAAPTRGRQTGSSSYWTNSVKFLPAPLQMRVLSATRWGVAWHTAVQYTGLVRSNETPFVEQASFSMHYVLAIQ